jgi:hypothetical protein
MDAPLPEFRQAIHSDHAELLDTGGLRKHSLRAEATDLRIYE